MFITRPQVIASTVHLTHMCTTHMYVVEYFVFFYFLTNIVFVVSYQRPYKNISIYFQVSCELTDLDPMNLMRQVGKR